MKNMYLISGDNIKTFPESALSIGVENTEIIVLNDNTKTGRDANRIFLDAAKYQNCPDQGLGAVENASEVWLSTIYFRDDAGGHFQLIVTVYTTDGKTPSMIFDSNGTSTNVPDVYEYTASKSGIPTFVKLPITSLNQETLTYVLRTIPVRGFDLMSTDSYFANTSYTPSAPYLKVSCLLGVMFAAKIETEDTNFDKARAIVNISWTDESQFTDLWKTVYQTRRRVDKAEEDITNLDDRVDQLAGRQRSLFVTR